MPSLSPLPSLQPGVTVVSKNDMCNNKVVADANPATRHENLALHQGSDNGVALGNGGGGSKPIDRHRPQGRFFVNDTEDAQDFVNVIKKCLNVRSKPLNCRNTNHLRTVSKFTPCFEA